MVRVVPELLEKIAQFRRESFYMNESAASCRHCPGSHRAGLLDVFLANERTVVRKKGVFVRKKKLGENWERKAEAYICEKQKG